MSDTVEKIYCTDNQNSGLLMDAITQLASNLNNLGDLNIVQQLKDCCCQTQQNLLKIGYE